MSKARKPSGEQRRGPPPPPDSEEPSIESRCTGDGPPARYAMASCRFCRAPIIACALYNWGNFLVGLHCTMTGAILCPRAAIMRATLHDGADEHGQADEQGQ